MVHRQVIKPADTGNFLNQIGSPVNITAPGWRRDVKTAINSGYGKAKRFENTLLLGRLNDHAGQVFDLVSREENAAFPVNARPHRDRHGRRATTDVGHHACDMTSGPDRTFGIQPPFKPVARIGIQIQLAAGRGHRNRVEHCDFEEHSGCVITDTGALTPHDTGKVINTLGITDGDHAGFHLIGLFVQRGESLTAICLPHNQLTTMDLVHVIGVERASQIKHHIVGDIDKRADRALANGSQSARHPVRAWPVGHITKGNAGDQRT